jgi:hypothetical protein
VGLVITCAFLIRGAFIMDGPIGWAGESFLVLGTLVFVFLLLHPQRLRLTESGFEFTLGISRRHNYRRAWSECTGFHAAKVRRVPVIAYSTDRVGAPALPHLSRRLARGDEALLADYAGISSEALAALMNDYRRRATTED